MKQINKQTSKRLSNLDQGFAKEEREKAEQIKKKAIQTTYELFVLFWNMISLNRIQPERKYKTIFVGGERKIKPKQIAGRK